MKPSSNDGIARTTGRFCSAEIKRPCLATLSNVKRCFRMVGDINIVIGARLRARRRLLGLSQRVLGDAIGVRFQQIQKYESAANAMSAGRLWAVAVQLGVGMNYFFDGLHRP